MVFETANLAAQYVMSGCGIALLDPLLLQEELYNGTLVQPFDTWADDGYGYYLLTHPDDLQDLAIASFRSWLIQHFAEVPVKLQVLAKLQT